MRLLALLLCLALPAAAQDRQGNDTPGDWIVDHTKHFGLWDSLCDHRMTGDQRENRCYIRYVDVFSPRPNFGAIFLFVTPEPQVQIGLEPGTLIAWGGIRIERDDAVVWDDIRLACHVGLNCTFIGDDAEVLLSEMSKGGSFAFDFTDRHGTKQNLRWDLTPFADALADYQSGVAARGL